MLYGTGGPFCSPLSTVPVVHKNLMVLCSPKDGLGTRSVCSVVLDLCILCVLKWVSYKGIRREREDAAAYIKNKPGNPNTGRCGCSFVWFIRVCMDGC